MFDCCNGFGDFAYEKEAMVSNDKTKTIASRKFITA